MNDCLCKPESYALAIVAQYTAFSTTRAQADSFFPSSKRSLSYQPACMGLFRKVLVFLILFLYAWTMLLFPSLVAQPFNSFLSVEAQWRVVCATKEAHALSTDFLVHRARASGFEEAVFKDRSHNLGSFAFQDQPHRVEPIKKSLNILNIISWGPRGLVIHHFPQNLKLFWLIITAVKAVISCHTTSTLIRIRVKKLPPTH